MNLTPWQWAIARGRELYPWQIEALEAFGRGYPTAVATCNGAGKTTVLAGNAVDWFFWKHPRGKLVATSSSFNQLQNQTWPALESRLPDFYSIRRGSAPLRIETPQGGEGTGFSTKEAGRAEGWHPTISPDVDPVMLLIDEAKTVPDAIWSAFDRCTLKYQLIISSPGPPSGRFFECFHSLRKYYWSRQVPSVECPHIAGWKRERDREIHGETSDIYRSMHLAEFTEGGEFLIITPLALRAALDLQTRSPHRGETVAFCDFARGRDENVLAIRRGNDVRIIDAWREKDGVQAVRRFIRLLKQEDPRNDFTSVPSGSVWGDADGLGGPMIDIFKDEGFPINEFHGGQSALDPVNYANLITEVWLQGVRKIERGNLHLGELDPDTFRQLTTRYLNYAKNGKKKVESKEDMAKRGVKSPDRADALLGAIMVGSHMSGAMTSEDVGSVLAEPGDFGTRVEVF
ncbi:hypothetical protein OKA04_23375 [Luteolibacter flavescens]|uniref:Terminase n=1 Tax=Luteolibacter flavescens TaxID=1859460 RepID=A0ABT3FVS0_9BACT|nr:hypothetical protein [Luteolibacter flavescens]MCW1887698.1 hypothetical protein [Luteolibacter flavescens]